MFFRKYKILGSSLIVAACISISFPSQASMTPMQNNYTLKGLSQHQQRETSAVIALKLIMMIILLIKKKHLITLYQKKSLLF